MSALADVRPAPGVKVALRVRPLPLRLPRVPLLSVMSAASNVVPGSSLKLKVMAAVSSTPRALTSLLILSVGATASTVMPASSPSAIWLRVAGLPMASLMVAPLSEMLLAAMLMPVSSVCPARRVYLNTSTVLLLALAS